MEEPTVADELAFAALPLETRELVERLYGGPYDTIETRIEERYDDGKCDGHDEGWNDAIKKVIEKIREL